MQNSEGVFIKFSVLVILLEIRRDSFFSLVKLAQDKFTVTTLMCKTIFCM
jgi:hypothetical protein